VDSQATQSGTRNRTATLSSNTSTATSYTNLSRKDQKAYKVKVTLYRNNLDLFNKEADGIQNILNWMVEKIDPHYVETCSPATNRTADHNNIAQFYSSLKATCSVNNA
jgi:hypothetical protein